MPKNWETEWRPGGVFDLVPDAGVVVVKGGTIAKVNSHLAAMFGYTREELIGSPIELLVPESARAAHAGHRDGFERNPHARPIRDQLDLRGRRKDGTDFPVSIMLGPITGRGDDRTMAVVRDLAATDATRRLAYSDPLTGLPNRAALFRDLGEPFSASTRASLADSKVTLALVELDGVHHINNSLGHAAGDEVLKSVNSRAIVTP